MALQSTDITINCLAQTTFKVRDNCANKLANAETAEGRRVWSRQLELINKQISDFRLERNTHWTQ